MSTPRQCGRGIVGGLRDEALNPYQRAGALVRQIVEMSARTELRRHYAGGASTPKDRFPQLIPKKSTP
jgi:hypothetical protein